MNPCTCPNQCPECPFRHPVASITHDHRLAVHGTACGGQP